MPPATRLLMQAVQRDNGELVDYLLKRRARLNTRNRNGETALSLAAYQGKLPFVKRLVEAGADVNLYGWPPLIYAAFNGHAAVVDYLLQKGAEINATTANGSTALLFAARFGHLAVVELLLQHKADPNIANERGATAIDWALKTDNTDIADLLRRAGGRAGDQPGSGPVQVMRTPGGAGAHRHLACLQAAVEMR
jgi:ankyrin repeat protein